MSIFITATFAFGGIKKNMFCRSRRRRGRRRRSSSRRRRKRRPKWEEHSMYGRKC
jgi:hypothetical protein